MRKAFVAALIFFIGCAHASRKGDPETRAMPEVPKKVAETASVPESAPESTLVVDRAVMAGALARKVRENVAAMLAALPRKHICGTPEFDAMNTALGAKGEEVMMLLGALESMVEASGKDVPAERGAFLAAMERFRFTCPDMDTLCSTTKIELECYGAFKDILTTSRAYAYALAGLLK